jgi:hypothetical protein
MALSPQRPQLSRNVRSLPHFPKRPTTFDILRCFQTPCFLFPGTALSRPWSVHLLDKQFAAESLRVHDSQQLLSWVHVKARSVSLRVKRVALLVIVPCYLSAKCKRCIPRPRSFSMTCQGLSFDREHETITLSFGIFRKTKGSSRRHPDLDIIASYKNSTESYLPLKILLIATQCSATTVVASTKQPAKMVALCGLAVSWLR